QPHGTEMDQLGLRVAGTGGNMDGVVVTEVDNSSNAAQKGIKTGDVILEVGGLAVKNPEDLANGIKEATQLGRKAVLVRVKSVDQTRFVAVPLNTTANKTSPRDLHPVLPADHIRVPELRFTVLPGSENNPSIAVTDVDKDSDAAQKGVKSGDSIKE